MSLSQQHFSSAPTEELPTKVENDTVWLFKSIFTLALVIGAIFVVEYLALRFTRDSALEQLHEEGIVTTAELTGQTLAVRVGGRGGYTTFKYCFKVDGDTKYFESGRTPPNTDYFSKKSSTFPVTYLPDDYSVHVFGDAKTGRVDNESVQYHGQKVVMILWFAKTISLLFGFISLVVIFISWFRSSTQSQSASSL
ncbi:MAG: hypothetical protein JNJ77_05125 [Planctomycetia bacterium]|nr:hypothetical protein [Planctomycetia bacterium]